MEDALVNVDNVSLLARGRCLFAAFSKSTTVVDAGRIVPLGAVEELEAAAVGGGGGTGTTTGGVTGAGPAVLIVTSCAGAATGGVAGAGAVTGPKGT